MRRRLLIAAALCAACLGACGKDEERRCILTYDRCEGGNPCEPICVFEDEAPQCTDRECPQPFEPPGECQLFANECVFR